MADALAPDEQRLIELLRYKIGFNALARITVLGNDNPLLKIVRYRVAAIRPARDEAEAPSSSSGEMQVNANLIERIFALALSREDLPTNFCGSQMIFYEVVDHKYKGFQTFILLFLEPRML